MKNETIEDELRLLKVDFSTLQRTTKENIGYMNKVIQDMGAQLEHLYAKLEYKIPYRKNCIECDGNGKVFTLPGDGNSGECHYCHGLGFRYL